MAHLVSVNIHSSNKFPMNKKVHSFSKKFLLLILSLFTVIACDNRLDVKNSFENEKIDLSSISDVRKDYEEKISKPNNLRGGKKRKEKVKDKLLQWDKSYTIGEGNKQRIVVPFTLKDEIYTKLPDSTVVPYSSISSFLVSGKKGAYTYEIATQLPDLEWLKNKSKPFTGKIVIEDINGNFVKGYRYKSGGEIIPLTSTESDENQRTSAIVMMCDITDWYTCVFVDGYMVGCSYDRTDYTNCEQDYDDWKQDKFSVNEDGQWYPNWIACNGCGASTKAASSINPTLFIMTAEQQKMYPRLTVLVKNVYEYVNKNADVMYYLKTFTGLTESQILDKIRWGRGPTVNVTEMTGRYGFFNANNPNVINISASWARGLEAANLAETQEATSFLLAVTVLHEFVHYGRNAAGELASPNGVEFGFSFEQSAYGVFITKENAGKYAYKFYKK